LPKETTGAFDGGFQLMLNRYPLIMSQMCYPLCHALPMTLL